MRFVIGILLTVCVLVAPVKASLLDWQALETDDFVIFYPKNYEKRAIETLNYLEQYRPRSRQLTGNTDNFKVRVVLQDMGLYANGYADAINSKIGVFTHHPYPDSTQNWVRLVSAHELIHMDQMLNASPASRLPMQLFGNSFSPNVYIPKWVLEGITVYAESENSPYEGRLNFGYYDAIVASQAAAKQLPSVSQANYTYDYYPLGSYYIYGGAFFRYLAATYGEEKFASFFTEYGQYFWAPYIGAAWPAAGLDRAAIKVYGKTLVELFADWSKQAMQQARGWQIKGERIEAGSGISLARDLTAYEGKLYYYRQKNLINGPYTYNSRGEFVEYDAGANQEKVLEQVVGSLTCGLQRVGDKLYYALNDLVRGYPNVDLNEGGYVAFIYEHDLKSGQKKTLFNDELMDFVVLPDERIVYVKERKSRFGSEIWQIVQGKKRKLGEVDQLIGEIKSYQSGFVVASKKHVGSWEINLLDLADFSLTPLVSTPWHEYDLKILGAKLYYTANYNQMVSVYEYDLSLKTVKVLTKSNYASGGLVLDNSLFFVGISSEGERVYRDNDLLGREINLPSSPKVSLAPPELSAEEATIGEFARRSGREVFSRNFSYFLWPSARLFPYLALGQDGLGLNQYVISYAPDGALNYYLYSKMFLPLSLALADIYQVDRRRTLLSLSLPAYYSLRGGLSAVYLTYLTDFNNSVPGLRFDFTLPRDKLSAFFQADTSDNGSSVRLVNNYLFEAASFNLSLEGYQKFDVIRRVRGLPLKTVSNTNGFNLELDYISRLAKVRTGFWNPNVFVADVFGAPFFEYSNTNTNILAYGYELSFEFGTAFWLQFAPKLGVSIIDGSAAGYFDLNFEF